MKNLAIIFDFDETLVEESTSALIERLGIDVDKFWGQEVKELLDDDWDPIPAYMFKLIEYSFKYDDKVISKQLLQEHAKTLKYKPGVLNFFENIKEKIKAIDSSVNLHYFVVSSGIGEVIKASEISKHFTDIWASDFVYDKNDTIVFPKKVLSFTDKTRYIFQISKGMFGEKYRGQPYIVNQKIENKDYFIPIENMIYIGDGLTDVACFSLINKFKGATFAVYDATNTQALGKAWQFVKDKRVNNLLSANFEEGSDLYNNIFMALTEMIKR